jgi:phosphate-selective porin OprO and OprP
MQKVLLLILLCFSLPPIFGQSQRNVDISNLPYYNFGKGLGLTSPDSVFQLNIRFRIQNRFGYFKNENANGGFDGQVRRLRLRFDGFVGNPQFLYVLQLSFAPGDVGEIEEGENLNIIRDAVVYYKKNNKWNFGFGQTKLPGNRQRVNSSGALQFADRTINNARFNIDRDFGFFINYSNETKNTFSYNIKSAISTGDGRNYTQKPDNGLAYTTKLELLPFGKFSKDGAYFEGDLVRESSPKLMISGAFHYNHKAKRQAGVLGDALFESRNLTSILLDGVFKYKGIALMSSYMSRSTNNPVTVGSDQKTSIVYTGQGFDVQGSYTFGDNWEVLSRFSKVNPSSKVISYFPNQQQISLGLVKYIWEHAFKLQLEGTQDRLIYTDGRNLENYLVRFQIEMGI